MAARATQYAEDTTNTTTTSTTYGNKVSVTFTPDASSNYAIFWSCNFSNSTNLTADAKARLQDTTNTITYAESNMEMKDLTDLHPFFGVAVFTSSGSPGSTTYALQFAAETSGNTINCQEARLLIMKLDAADQFTYTSGNSDTTSGTYTDVESLNFTPGSTGDYLIIASCVGGNSSGAGDAMAIRMLDSDGSTALGEMVTRVGKDGTNFWSWGTMIKKSSVSGSTTYKIQQKNVSAAGDTMRCRTRCILALRLDKLTSNQYAEDRARSTSTSASEVVQATTTFTPAADDYAVFGCAIVDGSSASISNKVYMKSKGTIKTDSLNESVGPGAYIPWMHFGKETLTAVSGTWLIGTLSETTGTTTGSSETAVALLQLTVASSGQTVAVTGATETDTAVTFVRLKSKALTGATETDTPTTITARKTYAAIIAAIETDSAVAFGAVRKLKAITTATETESAGTITGRKTYAAITGATETDSAAILTPSKRRSMIGATETDSAVLLAPRKSRAIGTVTETDTAQTITRQSAIVQAITGATETDTAVALTSRKLRAITTASETDSATAVMYHRHIFLVGATETETASTININPIRRLVGVATDTETAGAITVSMGSGPADIRNYPGWFRQYWRRRHDPS